MKLPLSRPSTRRSPSGYAAVISAPNSPTRRAIASSSKTIDFIVRPPVRRRTSVVRDIDTDGLRAHGWDERAGPGDAGHPDDDTVRFDDRPRRPPAPRNSRLLKAAHHQPVPRALHRQDPVTGARTSHREGRGRKPGRHRDASVIGRRNIGPGSDGPASPSAHPVRLELHRRIGTLGARDESEPTERQLRAPAATQRQTRTAPPGTDEPQYSSGPGIADRAAGVLSQGDEHRGSQSRIIPGERGRSNGKRRAVGRCVETRQYFENRIPGATVPSRLAGDVQQPLPHVRKAGFEPREKQDRKSV